MKKKSNQKNEVMAQLSELHGLRSILSVLTKDHDDLRRMIEVLKSESENYAKKKKIYQDFSELLKAHAACEEKAVYEFGLKQKDLKLATYEAYEEHAMAATLMQKLAKTTNKDQWMGRVKVLAESVEHHIIEEENEYLLDLKEKLTDQQELKMVDSFIKRRERSKHQPSEDFNGILNKIGEEPTQSVQFGH